MTALFATSGLSRIDVKAMAAGRSVCAPARKGETMSNYDVTNTWKEVDYDWYDYCLRVLPPAVRRKNAFAVGEPLTHDDKGPVHEVLAKVDGRYFSRNAHLIYFDPDRYTKEIKEQFEL